MTRTIECTYTPVATVKVTTTTYELNIREGEHNGFDLRSWVLRDLKHPEKMWYPVKIDGDIHAPDYELCAGTYEFQTLNGAKIRRGGNPVRFFIAGDTITHIR